MPSVNPLLGSQATPEVAQGYAAGMDDAGVYQDASARSVDDAAAGTNLKVAAILVGAVVFVVLLRKGGFRDMVTV